MPGYLPPSLKALIGQKLAGHFLVTKHLATGGMSYVFLARDEDLDEDVVVKVPKPELLASEEFWKHFDQEVEDLVKLRHPHIVSILARGRVDGMPYMIQHYYRGGSLKERLGMAKGQRESVDQILEWLPGVVSALDHIHKRGYIHLDVKPGNILFSNEGHVALADFGISQALRATTDRTHQPRGFGTPAYMAPEQVAEDLPLTGWADQYALAATVYEALTGNLPLPGGVPAYLVEGRSPPTPPSVQHPTREASELRDRAGNALLQALSWVPSNRYANGKAFLSAFEEGLGIAPGTRLAIRIGLVLTILGLGFVLKAMVDAYQPPQPIEVGQPAVAELRPATPASPPPAKPADLEDRRRQLAKIQETDANVRQVLAESDWKLRAAEEDPTRPARTVLLRNWRDAVSELRDNGNRAALPTVVEQGEAELASEVLTVKVSSLVSAAHVRCAAYRREVARLLELEGKYQADLIADMSTALGNAESLSAELESWREGPPCAAPRSSEVQEECQGVLVELKAMLAREVYNTPEYADAGRALEQAREARATGRRGASLRAAREATKLLSRLHERGSLQRSKCDRIMNLCALKMAAIDTKDPGDRLRNALEAIEEGPDVALNEKDETALHFAAFHHNVRAVEVLLQAGASRTSVGGEHRETPCRYAVVQSAYPDDDRPLHRYLREAKLEAPATRAAVLTLILLCEDVNEQDEEHLGRTPLHYAALRGDVESMEALCRAGATTDRQDDDGRTPLHLFVHKGHRRLPPSTDLRGLVTTLSGQPETLRREDRVTGSDPQNPLQLAIYVGNPALVNALLERGSDADVLADYVNEGNSEGYTALHFAAKYGYAELVDQLLRSGARLLEMTTENRNTPLHSGVSAGRLATVLRLLEAAKVRKQDHYANFPNLHRNTALHLAVLQHAPNVRIVKALLAHGGKGDALNDAKESPLKLAEELAPESPAHQEVLDILRK